MIKEAINKLTQGENLSFEETKEIFEDIFAHKVTSSQIAAFLIALRMKGESEDEIFAAASVIRSLSKKVSVKNNFVGIELDDEQILDTCGTGGSGIDKFNISTAVSFVVAAAGVKVAKHGNRAMSSSCGSADALEALGVKIDISPEVMVEAIKKIGIGFLYAPLYHPVLAEVAAIRKEIGVRTIFNILGPLCNPAFATHQVLGVYRKNLVKPIAVVLKKLGVKCALVVCSKDLKDEISLGAETTAAQLVNQKIKYFSLKPSIFGLKKVNINDIEVTNKQESAKLINDVLAAKSGPARNIVLANASGCFYVLGKAGNFKQGAKLAADIIDSGRARDKLAEFKNFINSHK
ncbi:MAG: anthranilate phosphoribosyltransferase [Candidatus Omnitrophica bacterium]|jgi:anthranilate phosphoribosyltransferase|nr:anthranilate phosphoribosyltransferase [Candidatus Omnitrophota bacterium]